MSMKLLGIISVGCHNSSTTNQIFYVWQILDEKWEYNGMVHQLFMDFMKAFDLVKREVL
jgi:hypothetical protein